MRTCLFSRKPTLLRGLSLLLLAASALLAGCATEPYRFRDAAPVMVSDVRVVPHPCGQAWDGCADRRYGIIYLRAGMSEAMHDCTLKHELRHLEGWNHHYWPTVKNCGEDK